MGKQGRRYRSSRGKTDEQANTTPTKHESRTPGLEDVVFTFGTAKDAATFDHTKAELVKFVGVQPWRGAAAASQALDTGVEPTFLQPTRPARPVKRSKPRVNADGSPMLDADGVQQLEDYSDDEYDAMLAEWKLDVSEYVEDMKEYRTAKRDWDDCRVRIYNLLLTHCPKELETKLKEMSNWAKISADRDAIELVKLIRGITHKHDETAQGTMAYMESDLLLYTTFMSKQDTLQDFYDLFTAQYETINAHSGHAG